MLLVLEMLKQLFLLLEVLDSVPCLLIAVCMFGCCLPSIKEGGNSHTSRKFKVRAVSFDNGHGLKHASHSVM